MILKLSMCMYVVYVYVCSVCVCMYVDKIISTTSIFILIVDDLHCADVSKKLSYYVNQSINQVYFQVNMYKNEQKVQFTVIHVQGNHVHLKEQLTCKTNFTN